MRFCEWIEPWLVELNSCKTYESFSEVLLRLKSDKDYDEHEEGTVSILEYVVFSYICEDISSKTRFQVIMDYIANNYWPLYWLVYALCSIYDPQDVLSSFHVENVSSSARSKRKRYLRTYISDYENGEIEFDTVAGYSSYRQRYYVISYESKCNSGNRSDYHRSQKVCRFFKNFSDFSEYREGDLTSCELSSAPISDINLSECHMDSTTKLPKAFFDGVEKQLVIHKYYDLSQKRFVWEENSFCGNYLVSKKQQMFRSFGEFVEFLKGDLSGADLIHFDGLRRYDDLSSYNLTGAKLSSPICRKYGLSYEQYTPVVEKENMNYVTLANEKKYPLIAFQENKNELKVNNPFLSPEIDVENQFVSYISDIHFDFKSMGNKSPYDVKRLVEKTAYSISKECDGNVVLIAGDTAADPKVFALFVRSLKRYGVERAVFVLGNHELWSFSGKQLAEIKNAYAELVENLGYVLLQNDICFKDGTGNLHKVPAEEIEMLGIEELRKQFCNSRLVMFGGIGFAGYAMERKNWYNSTVSPDEEIEETKTFERLYLKVCKAAKGRNLIVCTHMPKENWDSNQTFPENVVFVSGHNHANSQYDDGSIRVYADNQIGYKNDKIHLKSFSLSTDYDWFAEYGDGIYSIKKSDYEQFLIGKHLGCGISFDVDSLYMIKKYGYYCFMYRNAKGKLLLLSGGSRKTLEKTDISYYYDGMDRMLQLVNPLMAYRARQKLIANEVKSFNGSGKIHGCIVDISFYTHLFIDPNSDLIVPYYASDMCDRSIYSLGPDYYEFERLLKRYTSLYPDYMKVKEKKGKSMILCQKESIPDAFFRPDTTMYEPSKRMCKLEKLEKKVLTIWDEDLLSSVFKNKEKLWD